MTRKLQDLIDLDRFQGVQDRLHAICPFPSAIIDLQGNILTATGWQDVCTQFHRKHPECERQCIQSDLYIQAHLHEANPAVRYRCPHGLVDNALPIIIDGVHYANFFTGQFFLEPPDMEFFRAQAARYGFDEKAYLEAVAKVPVWSEAQLQNYLLYYQELIAVIADSGLKKLKETEHSVAQAALLEAHRRMDQIIEGTHAGTWEWNVQTGELVLNEVWLQIVGYTQAELAPTTIKTWELLAHPDDLLRSNELLKRHFAGELPRYECECRMRHKLGHWVWVLDRGQVITWTRDGQPLMMFGTHTDIHSRKQSELALLERETHYRELLEGIPGTVYSFSPGRGGVYYSPQVSRLLGYTPAQLRDQPMLWHDSIHPEDLPRVNAMIQEVNSNKPFCTEYRIRNSRGEWLWLEDRSIGYHHEGDEIVVQGIAIDITTRKAAEERIRTLSVAVEQSPASIVITDTTGAIEYVNPKFTQVTGYTQEEVVGRNPRVLKGTKTTLEEYRILWETITRGKEWRGEFHNRRKNGDMYWEFASISPIVNAGGQITHFLAIKEDITHRKLLEESLRQAQKMESIGVLAGGIAHDFNNILAAIMLHLGLLLGSPLVDQEAQSALKNLMANAKRAANLTRQLLMFCRKSVLDIKVLDLNDVVAQLLKMMSRLIGEHITIHFEPHQALPSVEADAGMVEQVVMNLALNARDAMPKGGELTIRLSPLRVDADRIRGEFEAIPGEFVCLTVSDTGCGMDDATLARIFEPFFTTKEAGKGTGLGLATVHGIVAQYRGLVEVESTPGKGTTFRVLLPACQGVPPSAPSSIGDISRGTEGILLVEDEAALRRAACMSLRALGYRVLEAENGPAAIRVWRESSGQVDLLLTDMVMPGDMTGLDLAGRLLMERPDLKVIISSGYNSEMAGQAMTGATGLGFLQKPYEVAALARSVRECLDGPRSGSSDSKTTR